MIIEKDRFVAIHYTLTGDDGAVIDSSVGGLPLGYVHGRGYLISGLENELNGKTVGDKFVAHIKPEDAYGDYDESLVSEVDRDNFETEMEIQPGMQFQGMSPVGPMIFTVIKVEGNKITVDGNHQMAGKNLHFDVEVVEVREATEEELNPSGCGCGGGCGGCGGDCGDGGCDGGCGGCN